MLERLKPTSVKEKYKLAGFIGGNVLNVAMVELDPQLSLFEGVGRGVLVICASVFVAKKLHHFNTRNDPTTPETEYMPGTVLYIQDGHKVIAGEVIATSVPPFAPTHDLPQR